MSFSKNFWEILFIRNFYMSEMYFHIMFICKQHYVLKKCTSEWKDTGRKISLRVHLMKECLNFRRLRDEERRLSLKSFFYQRQHYPRRVLKHYANVFRRMRDEWERARWKWEEVFPFFHTERVKIFHLALTEERFSFSSVAALLEACWTVGKRLLVKEEKWKFSYRICLGTSVKWKIFSHT